VRRLRALRQTLLTNPATYISQTGSRMPPHWRRNLHAFRREKLSMIPLAKAETCCSSSKCSTCGEKLHGPERGDAEHSRMPWCRPCKTWIDRDINAALNLSERGLARFASSLRRPASRSQQAHLLAGEKGPAGGAARGNPAKTSILRVDAGKSAVGMSRWVDRTPDPRPHPPNENAHPHPPFPVRLASASPGACGNPGRTLTPLTPQNGHFRGQKGGEGGQGGQGGKRRT
jgi:hypothetical protein